MLSPNTILQNRYRVVRQLGQGGMGAVYEAIDQRVSCVVALKQTLVGGTNEMRDAFRREAALLANLRHASLPKVMDYFGEADGEFLVMEFIAGDDLASLMEKRQAPFAEEQVLIWADGLLKLLEYLHSREPPILHRDIKPANLKVTGDGEIFLLDFGLAKGAAGQMTTVQTNRSIHGYSPVYAPLEQIHGQGTDPRTDLYSLGATLYDLLTGQPPVSAPVRFDAVESDRPDPLPPANTLNHRVSKEVAAVIQSAMSLSRRNRPKSAAEMREALQRAKQSVFDLEAARMAAERALTKTIHDVPQPNPEKPLITDPNVEFTVYSPKQIKPDKTYTMLAFAHLSRKRDDAPADEPDPIEEMKDQAARILGKQHSAYADAKEASSQPIPRDGEITFVPIAEGVTFSPASRSFTWRKSVHREEFDLWASPEFDGRELAGRMTVFLGSLAIAEVPLTLKVSGQAEAAAETIQLDSPQHARRARQIFASYSPQDERVVAELAQVAPIFGSRFVTDRTHLEPGEDRREGLQRLIRDADAFQLFWSTNAMRSADTISEIKYAASLGRRGFILPTYWEEPLPRNPSENLPPPEIDNLHFYRIYPGAISAAAFGSSPNTRASAFAVPATQASAMIGSAPPRADARTGELLMPGQTASGPPPASHDRQTPTLSGMPAPQPSPIPQASSDEALSGPLVAGVVCTNCQTHIEAGAKFCPRCGGANLRPMSPTLSSPAAAPNFRAAAPALAEAPRAQKKRRLMLPIMAGAAFVLFAAIVGPIWFLNMNSASNNSSLASAPPSTNSNASATQGNYANSSNTAMANSAAPPSPTPIMPKEITPPAAFIQLVKNEPAYHEPVMAREVDLNSDGVPDLLAQYEWCGSGGCSIHVYEKSGSGYKDISGDVLEYMFAALDDETRGSFVAGPGSTRGYLDLRYRFKKGGPALVFKFNGKNYRGGS